MNAEIFFFFFCTMINKWNLSRETAQMACPISFQNRKPRHDNWQASHFFFWSKQANVLCCIFLIVGK